ncbi:cysteine-rich RLK (RECEPTOR-like protein kinase) 8, partial [Striga hermonthica]
SGRGGPFRGRGGKNNGKPRCQICHYNNHTADKCYYRCDLNFVPRQGPNSNFQGQSSGNQYSGGTSVNLTDMNGSFGAQSEVWYPDSGATNHVTHDLANLNLASEYNGEERVHLGNGSGMNISHFGESIVMSNKNQKFLLKNLLHVPNITKNLVSVSQFAKDNCVFFEFHPSFCLVKDQDTKEVLLKRAAKDGLYSFYLQTKITEPKKQASQPVNKNPILLSAELENKVSLDVWHTRFGHESLDIVRRALSDCNIFFIDNENQGLCSACMQAKMHKLPFYPSENKSFSPIEFIHSDLWGPAPIRSFQGYNYYVSFIDYASRNTWVYLLKQKSETLQAFIHFKNFIENLYSKRIKIFQSDGGGEFVGMSKFLSENGIKHQISCPYTPEQNGLAERKHRHLIQVALALLAQSNLPSCHWDDAVCSAAFIVNRTPTKILDYKTPFEVLNQKKPDYSHLKSFGCLCYPLMKPYNQHRLQYKSQPSIFMGYSSKHKGYRVLLQDKRVILTRHVMFDESQFPYIKDQQIPEMNIPHTDNAPLNVIATESLPSTPIPSSPTYSPLSAQTTPQNSPSPSPQNSPNLHGHIYVNLPIENVVLPADVVTTFVEPSNRNAGGHSMITRAKVGIHKPKVYATLCSEDKEPKNDDEALSDPQWRLAMQREYDALVRNKTWTLTHLPADKTLIGSKWVYKVKHNADGTVARHKARLVAKGYTQYPGFDYGETFSPMAKLATIRTVLSIALASNWDIKQIYIDNAFLHGNLDTDLYMEQPVGFVMPQKEHLVCRLHKSIYGLKQASRAWFDKLGSCLHSLGFKRSQADNSLYYRHSNGNCTLVLVYVDDMVITGSNTSEITKLIDQLGKEFSLKDLGGLNYFLGIEILKTRSGLFLNQRKYIVDLLKRTGMIDSKGLLSPMVGSPLLSKFSGQPMEDPKLFRSVVGALQYATISRPELSYSVNKVSQYMQTPMNTHWKAVKRILGYLAGTLDYGMHFYMSKNLQITAYADADWGSDIDDRRSTSGFCIFLGPNLISWSSKKQHIVSRSSTEAEYRSLAHAACDVVWLQSLLSELKVHTPQPATIWMDNQGAVSLAGNPVYHSRTKHFEIDLHFIREKVV